MTDMDKHRGNMQKHEGNKRKYWTAEEEEFLEEKIGTFTAAQIARRLGRSFSSVNMKLSRMGIGGFRQSTDMLTMNTLHEILGVEARTVKKKWAARGLRIYRKGNYLCIKQEELLPFLRKNQDIWNAAAIPDDTIFCGCSWYRQKKAADTKKRYFWTREEEAKLRHLRKEGCTVPEIASKMGRSECSVRCKLYGGRRPAGSA